MTEKIRSKSILNALKKESSFALFRRLLLFTFFWGLLAHAYGFLNGFFTHDGLNALIADSTEELWKVELGRFLVPVYRQLVRSAVTTPWVIGVIGLFL
uniref:hypothetical protein n=1 Tax=Ndongobacter massiliensis TaxID=1871025 RepID=UPI0009302BB2|nr:hypothetical protein [Ndongobacter massiliensis]